ncbi:hypothetical protein CAOG_03199 [Capsaspora owczarzaki ATCC 30864]|uniref:protein-tyrosine-phosphatase n=1 Tax=Capsaspora owczarzaki (strain ATCC 30864) TaxID=595528 RepID=A0A0D2WMQ5_CAPO3|nr:hypothetical protein CAOG_03199 [Capsaspora owczarzaki ATCC 30864]KJE92185.1 hypothetical protein CAOG_003199 [Capsaspora owczarzaki ATCC 30864]|eukprot:XP_004364038.1 hypothetical protein CAOG_03199 [Capsaspora owczarzaki ATCC 30864]
MLAADVASSSADAGATAGPGAGAGAAGGPPPPPPPMMLPVKSAVTALSSSLSLSSSSSASSSKKPGLSLRDLIGEKQPEMEAEADLSEEQLKHSQLDLPRVQCPRCEKLVLAVNIAEHANSHSSEVVPGLFLGGMRNAHNKIELTKRTNVRHIVNVAEEVENVFEDCAVGCECSNGVEHNPPKVPHGAPAEARLFIYHSLKIKDALGEDALGLFDSTFQLIHDAIERKEPVLVHCVAGISRSASVCIAYLMRSRKWSLKLAFQHVRSARSIISPINWFILQLQTYEQRLAQTMELEGFHGQPSLTVADVYPEGTRFISTHIVPPAPIPFSIPAAAKQPEIVFDSEAKRTDSF